MHLSWHSPWYQHKLGDEDTKSSPAERDLGMLLEKKLNMIQQVHLQPRKPNHSVILWLSILQIEWESMDTLPVVPQ